MVAALALSASKSTLRAYDSKVGAHSREAAGNMTRTDLSREGSENTARGAACPGHQWQAAAEQEFAAVFHRDWGG